MEDDAKPTPEEAPAQSTGAEAAHAPAAIPTQTASEPERRRSVITVAIVVVALIAIVALGVAGWAYYKNTSAQRAAVDQLGEATALMKAADEVVLALDTVVQSEIASITAAQLGDVKEEVPSTTGKIGKALDLIDEAVADLPASEVAYARALRDTAVARLAMLEQAEPILDGNAKMLAALGPATEAWSLVDEGTELSREAVVQYNKLTKESITQSTALTGQAMAKFTEAKELFSKAATAFPEADLEQFVAFCGQRVTALTYSKQANEAHLAGKIAEANALGDKFNSAERDLVAKAGKLPASPKVPIAAAYDALVSEASARYFQARAQATEADSRLREAGAD